MPWDPSPSLYPPYLRSRIRSHRGVGSDASYQPWLHIRDVPSRGTSSVIEGILTGRRHHLLSELEATYLFLLERRSNVVNVLDQWPILDIDGTLELCASSGVRHPYRRGYPEPFTIDFLVCEQASGRLRWRAASVKPTGNAVDPNIAKRLKIEHDWCFKQGIPWTLVETQGFSKTLLASLRFVRSWYRLGRGVHPPEHVSARFARAFLSANRQDLCLNEVINKASKSICVSSQVGDLLFRYCGWNGSIPVVISKPISMSRPVVLERNEQS